MTVEEVNKILKSVHDSLKAEDVSPASVERIMNRLMYGTPYDPRVTFEVDLSGEAIMLYSLNMRL